MMTITGANVINGNGMVLVKYAERGVHVLVKMRRAGSVDTDLLFEAPELLVRDKRLVFFKHNMSRINHVGQQGIQTNFQDIVVDALEVQARIAAEQMIAHELLIEDFFGGAVGMY